MKRIAKVMMIAAVMMMGAAVFAGPCKAPKKAYPALFGWFFGKRVPPRPRVCPPPKKPVVRKPAHTVRKPAHTVRKPAPAPVRHGRW